MFTTKRLGALLTLAVAGVMALGVVTTGAWFTDSENVAVTATSGEVDITVTPSSFTVSNLVPGVYTDNFDVDVYNQGSTIPVKYRITDQYTGGDGAFFNEIYVRVHHGHCIGGDRGTYPVVYEGPLQNLDWSSLSSAVSTSLGVNITHCYAFDFALASTAGNSFQNLSTSFNLVVDATQVENPGWAQ